MQMNMQGHWSIISTLCWKGNLEKSTKFELVFCLQSMNYDADDALDVKFYLVTMTDNLIQDFIQI